MAKFRRTPPGNRWLGGVCAGLAYTAGIPVWIVRLLVVVTFLFYGVGILPYLLLWLLVPKWPELPADFSTRTGD